MFRQSPRWFRLVNNGSREAVSSDAVLPKRRNDDFSSNTHMQLADLQNDTPGARRSDCSEAVKVNAFTDDQAFSASAAFTLFAQELAYYRADAVYLPVEKCAARCAKLSALLTDR